MYDVCFCGWFGALTEREPRLFGDSGWGLACPRCGHIDQLDWLSATAREVLIASARRDQAATDVMVAVRPTERADDRRQPGPVPSNSGAAMPSEVAPDPMAATN